MANSARSLMAKFFYLISMICMGLGFYKMWVYDNGDHYPYETHNAYVGGDAYNLIINANYATAFFVLALIFAVAGSTCFIINAIQLKQQEVVNSNVSPALTKFDGLESGEISENNSIE